MPEVAYFPGCSTHATAREYGASIRLVCRRLGMPLREIEDWNCCGSTPAHTVDYELATTLAARNLALAGRMGADEVVTPCSGCYSRLKTAAVQLAGDDDLRTRVEQAMGMPLAGDVAARHLLEFMLDSIGLEHIAAAVTRPLRGVRLAAYYGCLLSRPSRITGFDDPEQPRSMDRLLAALGAEPLDWSHKAECCGGSLAVPETDLVLDLIDEILAAAVRAGAEAVVVACPLCQVNLDSRQADIRRRGGTDYRLPIIYFTQMMGLAFGFSPRALGMDRLLVSPRPRLRAWRSRQAVTGGC
jgi:heterodisulfide reductase subunit B2